MCSKKRIHKRHNNEKIKTFKTFRNNIKKQTLAEILFFIRESEETFQLKY